MDHREVWVLIELRATLNKMGFIEKMGAISINGTVYMRHGG